MENNQEALIAMTLDHAADLLWCCNEMQHTDDDWQELFKQSKKLFDSIYEKCR